MKMTIAGTPAEYGVMGIGGGFWLLSAAGNAYWQLSRQWIAATLNVQAGSDGSGVTNELAWGQALFDDDGLYTVRDDVPVQ